MRATTSTFFALLLALPAISQEAAYRLVCPEAKAGAWYAMRFWERQAQFETDEPVPAGNLAKHVADECRGLGLQVVGLMDSAVYLDMPANVMVEFDVYGPALRLERWSGPVPQAGEAADATIPPFMALLEPYQVRELQMVMALLVAAAGPGAVAAGPKATETEPGTATAERMKMSIEAVLSGLSQEQRAPAMGAVRSLLARWESTPPGFVATPRDLGGATGLRIEPGRAARQLPPRSPLGGMAVNYKAEQDGLAGIRIDLQVNVHPDQRKLCQVVTELSYAAEEGADEALAGRPVPSQNGKLENEKGFVSLTTDLAEAPPGRVDIFLPFAEIDDGWPGPGVRGYNVRFVLLKAGEELARQDYALHFHLKCEQRDGKRHCEVLPHDHAHEGEGGVL